jgi:cytochrome bd ubiquinol oxidase subunit I
MDVLTLSRLQFAITSMFHFIFVPLTLGLSILVAWMETKYVRTGDETWLRMAKFWGKLFLINFALGIVTGITMEFQFGMNWAEYSKYVGDIFGAPLAIEATLAFFMESVFIGVWVFGWNRISKRLHAVSIWLVAFATNLSALWILLANGWMQNPVGSQVTAISDNLLITQRAELTSFWAVATNPYGWLKFGHTLVSGYVLAAFFVMGISAWHLARKSNTDFFTRSFKAAAVFGLVTALLVAVIGDSHTVMVAKTQPSKFAAMESVWETGKGVGMSLLTIPDEQNEKNAVELVTIPKLTSFLATHDSEAQITGLKDIDKSLRPPVALTFYSFRIMVAFGLLMILASLAAVILSRIRKTDMPRAFLIFMICMIPVPYLAGQLGWITAEVGRQPWIVYGMLKTSDAVSRSIDTAQVIASLAGFTLLYGGLGVVDIYLLAKNARKGPDGTASGFIKQPGKEN